MTFIYQIIIIIIIIIIINNITATC